MTKTKSDSKGKSKDNKRKNKKDEEEEEDEESCSSKFATWKELMGQYLTMFASISSGMAGAGLGSGAAGGSEADNTGGNSGTSPVPSPMMVNMTNTTCGGPNPLADSITTIVSVYYSILGALMFAQIVTVFAKGKEYNDSMEKKWFTATRLMLTFLSMVSFIVGWASGLGCIPLNPFAIATSLATTVQSMLDQYEEVVELYKELTAEEGEEDEDGGKGGKDQEKGESDEE
eukprot:TRINITY_DN7513_c0_g2_i1.p1 TRINITY_DN7513_c0_g2~~TRINITY_DN7513_c0_g2_i1.p1  ORF type:complete len:230 (+),score=63.15 TRINITY_DN7513_c0_g2_i1:75-764(+)